MSHGTHLVVDLTKVEENAQREKEARSSRAVSKFGE